MPKNQVSSIKVIIEQGNSLPSQIISLSLLEDFNYAVQQDVNSKARKAYSRSVKRSMFKKFTAVAGATATLILAEEAVRREENLFTLAAYATSYLSAATAADQIDRTETAGILLRGHVPGGDAHRSRHGANTRSCARRALRRTRP